MVSVALDGTTILAIPPDIWNYARFLLFCLCVRMVWKGCIAIFGSKAFYDSVQHRIDFIDRNFRKTIRQAKKGKI